MSNVYIFASTHSSDVDISTVGNLDVGKRARHRNHRAMPQMSGNFAWATLGNSMLKNNFFLPSHPRNRETWATRRSGSKKTMLCKQGCQMFCFQTKNPILGKFLRVLHWKIIAYFLDTWSILRSFVIFYGNLVEFLVIWLFLVFCTKKNLATLMLSHFESRHFIYWHYVYAHFVFRHFVLHSADVQSTDTICLHNDTYFVYIRIVSTYWLLAMDTLCLLTFCLLTFCPLTFCPLTFCLLTFCLRSHFVRDSLYSIHEYLFVFVYTECM
jgi:hypothetical protein